MLYQSTRGRAASLSFDDAVLAGLAPDGGLYVPESLPQFTADDIRAMKELSYVDLAVKIMLPFMGAGWTEARLKPLLEKSYSTPNTHPVYDSSLTQPACGGGKGGEAAFRDPQIAPLHPLGGNHHLLELFHGPTLAFKDFALQFLGHLLGDILSKRDEDITILGATSGDTGSAAIAGCMGISRVRMFILYPHERVSDVQRRQMTTLNASNVHALALQGNFDDCQNIVKELFAHAEFNTTHKLVAVNSINWARIMAQIVYYFYAALKLGAPEQKICFSVPTGNFGDIFAGWLAKHMGLPVEKLIIASNANDILTRCWHTGRYEMKDVVKTLSPSMDIQISSNFERLLYLYADRNAEQLAGMMQTLKTDKTVSLPESIIKNLNAEFFAASVDDAATAATIKEIYDSLDMLVDPHTATGIHAAKRYAATHPTDAPIVTLATAHPAKFPDAVKAATGKHPELPEHLADLFEREELITVLPATSEAVAEFVKAHS